MKKIIKRIKDEICILKILHTDVEVQKSGREFIYSTRYGNLEVSPSTNLVIAFVYGRFVFLTLRQSMKMVKRMLVAKRLSDEYTQLAKGL